MFLAPMPSYPHVFKENLEGIDISLTPWLHPYSFLEAKLEKARHMPTFFACPCFLKKLRGGRHVPTPVQLASKWHLKKLGGSGYVPTLSLYIFMLLKKLGEGRYVPIPLDGKLIIKLFEGYQDLKSIHQIKLIFFTYYKCFELN
jgi:hypothetical protein